MPRSSSPLRSLVWFRGRDLRLEDQPALAAAASGPELIPLVVRDPAETEAPFRDAFRDRALAALDQDLRERGSRLVSVAGDPLTLLPGLVQAWGVTRVEALRRVEPSWRALDDRLQVALAGVGCRLTLHEGDTLAPPGSVRTGSGGPFSVFTPFSRAFSRQISVPWPLPVPARLPPVPAEVPSSSGFPEPGEPVRQRLEGFLAERLAGYGEGRNRMDQDGISRLSGDLRAGTLSVRTLWHAVSACLGAGFDADVRAYLNELLWREFAHHVLWERPELVREPFRGNWADFPWRTDPEAFAAWQEGRTGQPLVDAAARELLATGFVHNRARMVAASYLCKQLMLDWRLGEAHYRRFLVDGCEAANSLGWQWSAGCGVDAQPWFRIFNPETQGRKFDPAGAYVRRWVPELASVPDRFLHAPQLWDRPLDYPAPIVDHGLARQRFLAAAKASL